MLRLSPIAGFLCRFVIFFAVLSMPWPGRNEAGSAYFRALAGSIFGGTQRQREVTFETIPNQPEITRAIIVNRALMARDGSGPVRNLDVDLGRLGLRPLALLLALIFATPVSRKRRAWASLTGILILHGCLLAFLNFCLWVDSADVFLVRFSPSMMAFVTGLKAVGAGQFGMAVPVLIWIVTTLRREDVLGVFRRVVSAREVLGTVT